MNFFQGPMQILVGMSKSQYMLNTLLKQNFVILINTLCLSNIKLQFIS
jgi:hypothetical protein